MADVDNNSTSSTDSSTEAVKGLRTELDAKLGEVNDQLKAMNAQFRESLQSIASSMTPATPPQQTRISDEDMWDAGKLEDKIVAKATEISRAEQAREREMNTTIYNLAQEYPEIQSDPTMQKAVREAQATLPQAMQNSAIGLETAVLKAVSKAGLLPKSKRSAIDEDASFGPSRSTSEKRTEKKSKVNQSMLDFAQLLGRDITDKNVLKGLEEAAARDTYSKYR